MEEISNTFFFKIWEFIVIADPTMGGFRYNPPRSCLARGVNKIFMLASAPFLVFLLPLLQRISKLFPPPVIIKIIAIRPESGFILTLNCKVDVR